MEYKKELNFNKLVYLRQTYINRNNFKLPLTGKKEHLERF